MEKGNRPGLLRRPGEKRNGKWRGVNPAPLGNLKCDWNIIVMSYEDHMKYLQKNRIFVIILVLSGWVVPIFVGLAIGLGSGPWSLGLAIGIVGSLIFGGMFTFLAITITRRAMDTDIPREIKTGWNDVGHSFAMHSVKLFAEEYGVPYVHSQNFNIKKMGWKYPEEIYTYHNKVRIKAEFSYIHNQPAGWCSIEYKPLHWEQALQLQLALDDFMYRNGALRKRSDI